MNALGYVLGLYTLYWFKKLDLDVKYQKEIEEWLLYTKQKKFNKKLDRQMINEINRYMRGKKSIEKLIKKKFPKPEFRIEYPE